MSIVTIMPSGKTVEAGEGMTILAAILQADPDFPHKCEGNAKCGSCHIYVLEGRKGVTKTTRDENGKLDELFCVGSK